MSGNNTQRFHAVELLIGLLMTLFVIGLVATCVIQFRPFYYMMVPLLHIPETSGYPKEEILLNFNALMDYLIPFTGGELVFPTLPASETGLQHFAECKNIFNLFAAMIPVCGIPVYFLTRRERKKGNYHYLLTSALMMIILPLILGLGCAIDFDRTFTIFHKIFFRNDFWIFSPSTDPIINMLPEEVFLIYGLLMVFFVLLTAVCMILRWRKKRTAR